MRTFVLGDLHGAYRAMMQCFERSSFDYENDKLIFLGDIFDGWSEAGKCIDELMKVKHLVHLLGNHDDWTLQWALTENKSSMWLKQGGQATIEGYAQGMPKEHKEFLLNSSLFHIDSNRLFVHAGFVPDADIEKQGKEILLWDRTFIEAAIGYSKHNYEMKFTKYKEVYLGHTPTLRYGMSYPYNIGEVWLMDTGAGWKGMLSIMDIDTKDYCCSDNVAELYPDEKGRF